MRLDTEQTGRSMAARLWSLAAALTVIFGSATSAAGAQDLTVLGPSCMERSLRQISSAYTRTTGQRVLLQIAPTAELHRLIVHGSRPDILVNTRHRLASLRRERLILSRPEAALASVRLVIVEPRDGHVPLRSVYPGFPIREVLGPSAKIAVPDPAVSPAGSRAMAALETLGGWISIGSRMLLESNSQQALKAVSSGDAILAVVYDTDAKADPSVRILSYLPEATYPRLVYAAAVLRGPQSEDADRFLTFLRGSQSREILKANGFGDPRR